MVSPIKPTRYAGIAALRLHASLLGSAALRQVKYELESPLRVFTSLEEQQWVPAGLSDWKFVDTSDIREVTDVQVTLDKIV